MSRACFPARASDKMTEAFLLKPVLQRTSCFPKMGPDNMLIGFGGYVGRLRNEKGLSYRQMGQLAGIDHASLRQLEGGEKKDLSEDMVNSLIRVLSPGKRKTRMLRFLLSTPVDEHLLGQVLEDPEISLDDFESAAHICAPNRPSGREEWHCLLTQVRSSREKMKRE
jgi:transcriptional regulator with XRE-family HTH domain